MPLRTLITILTAVIGAAALTVGLFTAFIPAGAWPYAGVVTLALVAAVRFAALRRPD